MSELRITVRFLQPYSHGRGEDGLPEWPPSPLRLFQALVASAIGKQPDAEARSKSAESLRWLERQPSPEIVAPVADILSPHRSFVPDNSGDQAARSWSAGRDASLADYRTEKDVRPVRLHDEAVHYLFRPAEGLDSHASRLQHMARSITHLGWGVDMVVGDASASRGVVHGERWIPGRRGGVRLRTPVEGTLEALERKHDLFLRRLEGGIFRPVPALAAFTATPYARPCDAVRRPFAAFRLMHPSATGRLWLDPPRRARDVAAWMRHAVGEVSEQWPFGPTATLVHGHGEPNPPDTSRDRMAFLPLPTINPRLSRIEGISRVAVSAPEGFEREIAWLQARLAGHDLVWRGSTVAFLDPLSETDWVLRQYLEPSRTWSTVTPVVLPGHDDRSTAKAERLLRKAFLQAGFDPEVVASIDMLDWGRAGFLKGTDLAGRYLPPDKVTGPMFHVRVRFAKGVVGPIAVGSGRYRGMGIFARE